MLPGKALYKHKVLLAALGMYIIIYLFFYPPFYASVDEHEYIRNSYLLQEGTLTEADITQVCTGKFNGEGYVSQYFIGRSVFLIPFTQFGLHAIILSGLVIHLLNFFIFYKILKRLKVNGIYSILYLLYPSLFWASRTLGSELLVLTGILAGVYFYLSPHKKSWVLGGMFFGLSLFARYDAIFTFAAFFLVPLAVNRKKFALMVLGVLPVLLLLFGVNSLFYGGIASTGYGDPLGFIARIGSNPIFIENLVIYVFILSATYPLMLFSSMSVSGMRYETILTAVIAIVFWSQSSGIAALSITNPSTIIGGIRYLIPLIGILLVPYSAFVDKLLAKNKKIVLGIFALLFMVMIYGSHVHSQFLDSRSFVFDAIYSNTEKGSLIIGSEDDCNYILNGLFEERAYLDINRPGINEYVNRYEDVYVLYIWYSNVDPESVRGGKVVAERQKILDFIENNRPSINIVFNSTYPHRVQIYKFSEAS